MKTGQEAVDLKRKDRQTGTTDPSRYYSTERASIHIYERGW